MGFLGRELDSGRLDGKDSGAGNRAQIFVCLFYKTGTKVGVLCSLLSLLGRTEGV